MRLRRAASGQRLEQHQEAARPGGSAGDRKNIDLYVLLAVFIEQGSDLRGRNIFLDGAMDGLTDVVGDGIT
jgi:hypothetical protein